MMQDRSTSGDDRDDTTCRIIADVFAVITAVPNVDAADAEAIAMETLIDAHHPVIGPSLLCYLSSSVGTGHGFQLLICCQTTN